jgi:hypothetical protein
VADDVRRFGAKFGDNRRYRIPYLRALATLTAGRGGRARALDHLQEAALVADAIGLPGETWEIDAALGSLHEARGDAAGARLCSSRAAVTMRALAAALPGDGARAALLDTPQARLVLAHQPWREARQESLPASALRAGQEWL